LRGEPRPEYVPGRSMMSRYGAKAEERGVHVDTIRRWVRHYRRSGLSGLLDERRFRE
jgi:transposase